MNALSISESKNISLVEVDVPACGDGDVLLWVAYGGYCGTDLNTFRGLNPLVTYPRSPGHGRSGTIVEIDAEVSKKFTLGQDVLVLLYFNCCICRSCKIGRPNACENNQTMDVQRGGAITEYIVLPWQQRISVDRLSLRNMALVEPLAVGCHAVWRGGVESEETVGILGAIGIGTVLGARCRGATVISVDVSAPKLAQIKRLGAHHTVDGSTQDVVTEVWKSTGNDVAHVVIEAVGLPQTFVKAVDAASFGGRVVYVGYAKDPVQYEIKYFVMKEINILGSHGARREISTLPSKPCAGPRHLETLS